MCSQPFLTLCMIAKNEEEYLPRTLQSVQGLVDEIILVDTGSEDKTLEIAQQFGAKVYTIPWQNDFSLARNYALDQAQGQWVLFLDADEELRKVEFDLQNFLKQSKEEGFFLKIINFTEGKNTLNSYAFRLFRNKPLYRYEGKLHEQILPTIQQLKPEGVIDWLNIEVYHYGYQEKQIIAKNKVKRNLEILLNEEDAIKNTPFYCFNIGMEYLRLGRYTEAEQWLKEGWEKVDNQISFAHRLIMKTVICLFLQRKYREAVLYCQQGEKIYPDYADLYYYHGASLMELGNLSEAGKVLLLGIEKGISPGYYISEAGCGSYLNLELLGIIEETQFNFNLATDYFFRAFNLKPDDSYYLQHFLVNLLKSDFDPQDYFKENAFLYNGVFEQVPELAKGYLVGIDIWLRVADIRGVLYVISHT